MKFQQETYCDRLVDEIYPLLKKHYLEIAHYKDIPLDPDWQAYLNASTNGMLRIFTAREGERLVGYQVFFVRTNVHYKSSLQAVQDILFLDPVCRAGLTGYRFIKWCDGELRHEGVQVVCQHIKAIKDFGYILERMGYQLIDQIYARRLD